MPQPRILRKVKTILVIIILVSFGFLTIIHSNLKLNQVEAASTWTQTSDEDFSNGESDNLTIVGVGDDAELQIDISELQHWTDKQPSSNPGGRYWHTMASIWNDDKVAVFGGYASSSGYDDKIWVYDYSNNTWNSYSPSTKPSGRRYPAMAGVYGTDETVLFGGLYTGYLDDTWIYDLSLNTWSEKTHTTKPSGRYMHAMASVWNDDKVVLFGGYSTGGLSGETWIYDLGADTWTLQTPTTSPTARSMHTMATIYGDDKVVLYGGYDSTYRTDTWIYDVGANTWTLQTPSTNPGSRTYTAMASIDGTDNVMLFGGYYSTIKDDTWIYDLNDDTWVEKILTVNPGSRYMHTMASIGGTDKVVLYGGYGAGIKSDTWVYKHFLKTKNGTFVSAPYDTCSNSSFSTISWFAETPENTSIELQLRTAAKEASLAKQDFVGPDGTSGTYYTTSPSDIWSGHEGDRWIQYKVYFNITRVIESPSLKDVTISYNCLPNTIVIGPTDNSMISNNKPTFKWTFEDFDSVGQKGFQVVIDNDINFSTIDFDSGEQNTDEEKWEFPSGTSYTELPDGTWYWKVRTKDSDDVWTKFSTPWSILIDSQAPTSATAYPINDGYYNSLTKISGIANDVTPSSGLNKIEISIKRLSNNRYWNGTTWVPLETWLIATGTNNWFYDSSIVEWTSGMKYRIQSRAVDNVFNIEKSVIDNIFMIDQENPKSKINNPPENVWLRNLNLISGSARDFGGSGVNMIEISIMCSYDFISWDEGAKENQFWSGDGWVKEKIWLIATGTDQWNVNASNVEFTTGDHYTIQSRAIDNTHNVEKEFSEITFMYDAKPPEGLVIHINKNDEYTDSNSVHLSLQADDPCSGLYQMAFSTDSAVWSNWEPFSINRNFELSSGDGKKTIYYKVKDYTGNIAEPVLDTILLDTTPPEDLSIIIEENSKYVTAKRLQLDLKATDKLSGVSEFSYSYNGIEWVPWEPFTQVRYLNLPDSITDGQVTIYYKVKDKVGNIAAPVSDSIILDTLPPYSLSMLINQGAVETNSTTVSLDLYAIDNTSGVDQISFSTDGESWSNWVEFNEETFYLLPPGNGMKTIYFKVKDEAGNIAEPVADSILLNITVEEHKPTDKTQASDTSIIWNIIFIIIIVIMFLIIIGMFVILKRKKRVEEEGLPAGAVTIRPGGLYGPSISIGQRGTFGQPQLPGTQGVYAAPQQGTVQTPIPMLAKSTQQPVQQPPQPPSQPTVIPQVLPALPPAKIPETQPKVEATIAPKPPTPTLKTPPTTQQITAPQPRPTIGTTTPGMVKPTVSTPTVSQPQTTQQKPQPKLETPPSSTPTTTSTQTQPTVAPKPTIAKKNNTQS